MNTRELEIWILDTIAEGGYSFKELFEHICNEVKQSEFIQAIINLHDEKMVYVYLSAPNSASIIALDDYNQDSCVKYYETIVLTESLIGSRHYWQLSDAVKNHLNDAINNKA